MSLLIYPPFADPTQSYPALPLLKGYLKNFDEEIHIVDFNLEGLLDAAAMQGDEALSGFYDPDVFYDERMYKKASQGLKNLYANLSRVSGTVLDNNQHFDPLGPWTLKKLKTYFQQKRSPFHHFYQAKLSSLMDVKPLVIGINLTFASQIPEAFYIAQWVRAASPSTFILLGGALAGQIVTQISEQMVAKLLRVFNGICYFEGGPTLRSVISQLKIENRLEEPVPNMVWMQDGRVIRGPEESIDFQSSSPPDFDGFDLNKYLAPSPIILFHPTAGCYWNRCSFCRYGFNQECGARYREMNPVDAAAQIQALQEKYRVDNFYMSADVLSPKFAVGFAAAMLEKKIEIKWSTDLRIEKSYTKEVANLLARSGLVSVAFGIESGSDRILKKMDKGINRDLIAAINRNFNESGIATCWMMFHYHPTETLDEATESIRLLEQHRKHIALFIVGEFGLTPHSKIYDNPAAFEIQKILYHPQDVFQLYPYPEYGSNQKMSSRAHMATLDQMTASVASHYLLRSYPYAGAISTHHSMLYFVKKGKDAFHRVF